MATQIVALACHPAGRLGRDRLSLWQTGGTATRAKEKTMSQCRMRCACSSAPMDIDNVNGGTSKAQPERALPITTDEVAVAEDVDAEGETE